MLANTEGPAPEVSILPEGVHLLQVSAFNEAGENAYYALEYVVNHIPTEEDRTPPVTEVRVAPLSPEGNVVYDSEAGTIFVSSPTELTLLAFDVGSDTKTMSGVEKMV